MADMSDQVLTLGVNDICDSHHFAFTSSYVCGGKQFEILVTDDPPPGYDRNSTDVGWATQLMEVSMHDDTDPEKIRAHDEFMEDLAEEIKGIALPTLLEIAPPAPGSPPPSHPMDGVHTVQEHLYPDVVKLQLVSRDSHFELIQGHNTKGGDLDKLEPITHDELRDLGLDDISSLPTYAASEILLLSRFKTGMSAYDATVLGRAENLVCKLLSDWFRRPFLRELGVLVRIEKAKASLGPETRVSTLKGLVTYRDGVVGMLMDKIPAKLPMLDDAINARVHVPFQLRDKWAVQIENTVSELHRHGIVWGDAKPGNVIIDECDDAWLVDFGGGYTEGWVEQQLVESIEGDLQAVRKMKEKLKNNGQDRGSLEEVGLGH